MFKRVFNLFEYITCLYKYNLELQKSTGNIFRIIKKEKDKNGDYQLDIQVINKSTVFRCSAKEIAAKDQLLECFSKSDVRLITYLATQELLKPKNKIIGIEYTNLTERAVLQIKQNGSDKLTKITADKILGNSELLKNLSPKDAHKAGYLMGIEEMILEKEAIMKYKKSIPI